MEGNNLRRMFNDFHVAHYDHNKPSTFLKIMRILTQTKCSEEELTEIFLDLMPHGLRRILELREFKNLTEMSEFADKIVAHVNGHDTDEFIAKTLEFRLKDLEEKSKTSTAGIRKMTQKLFELSGGSIAGCDKNFFKDVS